MGREVLDNRTQQGERLPGGTRIGRYDERRRFGGDELLHLIVMLDAAATIDAN